MFKEATAILQEAITLNPQYPEAHVQLGRAFAFQGQLDKAQASYTHALTLDPDFVHAMTSMGKLCLFQRRWAEAKFFFTEALARDPQNVDAHLGLAKHETQTADGGKDVAALERALVLFEKALALAPNNEQGWFEYGVVLSQLGRHAQVININIF
jgi:tetratricopeptide (TPR) repeat protein